MSRRRDLALVIAIAAIAHFTYFALRFGSFYFPDSFTYLNPARYVLEGRGFVNGRAAEGGGVPLLEPDTIRTPGYPLVLMLFGAHTVPVIVLQHLLDIAIAALLYLFVMHRWGNRFAALAAAIAFALDVPSIHIASKLLTETIFTALLFAVFVLLLDDEPPPITIGLLLGFMVLVRPIALFFFAIAALRIPRRRLIAFLVAALVLPAGWAARNLARAGVFTVSSIGSINMLSTRAAGALAIEDNGDNFYADLNDEQRGLAEDADDWIQERLHIPDAEELSVGVRARYYGEYGARILAEHPLALAELTVRGILVNLFDSDWDAIEPVSTLHPSLLRVALGAVPVAVTLFASIGILVLWRTDRLALFAIAFTVGYFVLISAGAEAEYRFRVPVMPQLAIAAAIGLDRIRAAVVQNPQPTDNLP